MPRNNKSRRLSESSGSNQFVSVWSAQQVSSSRYRSRQRKSFFSALHVVSSRVDSLLHASTAFRS